MDDIDETIYELECDSCGATYEIVVNENEKNEPVYCPFCGADIDIEPEADEDDLYIHDIDDEYDELDFDDYRDWLRKPLDI